MLCFRTSTRIALSLALLSANVVLIAQFLGMIPDKRKAVIQGRVALCEAMAVYYSFLMTHSDMEVTNENVAAVVHRNDDMLSAAIREQDGQLIAKAGNHEQYWGRDGQSSSTGTNISVPIIQGSKPWGNVEISFIPIDHPGIWGVLDSPFSYLLIFLTTVNAIVFIVFLNKVLHKLDPSKVVPKRVCSALDTLAEGVLVLDKTGKIMFANSAFGAILGERSETLLGRNILDFAWAKADENARSFWTKILSEKKKQIGMSMSLESGDSLRTFKVNTMPIRDELGLCRGFLASFDDVTALENKKTELFDMLEVLKQSRDKVRKQNEQLQVLATRDSLTACLNRRAFFEQFENQWNIAERYGHRLSCIMTDIDHFKSVNDKFGHARGDAVLKRVAAVLQEKARNSDLVCRYGGEEFCILLPNTPIEEAYYAAERFRKAISELEFPDMRVTVSLGVSTFTADLKDPAEMLNQADECLYVAKRKGRNHTVRSDDVHEKIKQGSPKMPRTNLSNEQEWQEQIIIPFHAVKALLSALAYRDERTAAHCGRVADLSVSVARGLMSVKEIYILEVACLLHDIGKIGVPDSILLKPGPLNKEEKDIMYLHDQIGVEIIASSFACPMLIEFIRGHSRKFDGDQKNPHLSKGKEFSIGARILAIADAYDTMVSDQTYRKGQSREAAFAELRRYGGSQFDPKLVERFIEIVKSRPELKDVSIDNDSQHELLQIGLHIERLAEAVDALDIPVLTALASQLEATSKKCNNEKINKLACELQKCASNEIEPLELIDLTIELINLCWAMQRPYINPHIKKSRIQEARVATCAIQNFSESCV